MNTVTETDLDALRSKMAKEPETEASTVSLEGMNQLAEKLSELKDQKKAVEDQLSEIEGNLKDVQQTVIDTLITHSLTSYRAPAGLLTVTHHFTAKLPQGEDKVALYNYLKQIGRFEDMASIHSQTFNSWVKEQYDLAREENRDEPKLPGVTDVQTLLRISFRRAK